MRNGFRIFAAIQRFRDYLFAGDNGREVAEGGRESCKNPRSTERNRI